MAEAAHSNFRFGTKLAYPIFDDRGNKLLAAGVELTPRLVSLLERRGIRLQLKASLEVLMGGPAGSRIPIAESPFRIGRRRHCHVRPRSPLVSGIHCVLYKQPIALRLRDADSTNGTYLNGVRIGKPVDVKDGDEILLGDVALKVRLHAALEGEGTETSRVARLILADRKHATNESFGGDTLVVSDEDSHKIKAMLQRRRRQTQEAPGSI